MTSIEKLSIKGIRSFSPNTEQVIEFHKPLTVIVGKNGSGKTTIIETLAMATTGTLPPNCRNGQAFINDPNIHGGVEVKAQIKLRFCGANKKPAVVTRNFSLVQKPAKKEYKAFEAALRTVGANGETSVMSFKTADLNKLVPEMMGVSTAVLESVVFVHQEDSCWPLAEDKVLKQKFDDIFAATEYTKALDQLKTFKNEKAKDIRALAAELETLETKLTNANRMRTELEHNKETLEGLEKGIAQATQHQQDASARLPALRATINKRDDLRAEMAEMHKEHHHAMELVQGAEKRIETDFGEEVEESDEELRQLEVTQGSQYVELSSKLDRLKAQIANVEIEIENAERRRDQTRAMLESERAKEAHHKQVQQEAVSLASQIEASYQLPAGGAGGGGGGSGAGGGGSGGLSPAERAQQAADGLLRVRTAREAELQRAKDERQSVSNVMGGKVQKNRVELEHIADAAAGKERDAAQQMSRMRSLEQRLDDGGGGGGGSVAAEAELTRLRQEVRDAKDRYAMAEEDLNSSDLSATIAEAKTKRRSVKDKIQQCNEELNEIEKEGDKKSKLRQQELAVEDKRTKLEVAIAERRPRLAMVLDVTSDDSVMALLERELLSSALVRKRAARDEDAATKENEVKAHETRKNRKETECHVKNESRKRLEEKIAADEAKLKAVDTLMVAESYDWDTRQQELEAKVEERGVAAHDGSSMLKMLEKHIPPNNRDKCFLCEQGLSEPIKQGIKRKADMLRGQLGGPGSVNAQHGLAEAQENLRRHKEARMIAAQLRRDRDAELPATQQNLDGHRAELATLQQELARLNNELKGLQDKATEARDLHRHVDHLNHLYKEFQAAKGELLHTQSGMQSGMHSINRSREVVTSEREVAHGELDRLERAIDEKGQQLESVKAEYNSAAHQQKEKELELSRAVAAMEKRQELELQIAEAKQRVTKLQQEAKELRESEAPKREQLKQDEDDFAAEQRRLDASIREHDSRVTSCTQDHSKLADFAKRLGEGSSATRAQLLHDVDTRHREAEQLVSSKRAELKAKQTERDDLADTLKGQDKIKMAMRANLELRELRAKERTLHEKLGELNAQYYGIEGEANAAEAEEKKLRAKISEAMASKERYGGSKATIKETIKNLETALREPQYRKVDAEHREKLIEHKTVQMAVDDLTKYYKALNSALMKFHETKMADINKSITELWNKTYKGSDIDGIAIKTEDEGQTADGRRKQSYRVVMRKGDTQLDMRGRCSAGQKVLASLVIRLALAESFCLNCGILTLDEPTTNLDRANIESLALAINEIIKARRQQTNFQLIVITHDEDFVQQIGRSENCSYYYWVEKRFLKDGDPPASTITKKDIMRFG